MAGLRGLVRLWPSFVLAHLFRLLDRPAHARHQLVHPARADHVANRQVGLAVQAAATLALQFCFNQNKFWKP